jgi:hypothetical protein
VIPPPNFYTTSRDTTRRDRALGILIWAELEKGYELERLGRQEVERLKRQLPDPGEL